MRIVASALLAAVAATVVAASGGVASAQGAGSPAGVARTAYTVEPFTPAAPVTIQGQGVRLRAEPFATKNTPVLSSGSTGLQLNIVGVVRQSDWDWYQVVLRNGQKAYIRSDLTTAPSRGTAASAVTNVPSQPAPQVAATPPRQTPALPPITPQPQQNTGAISLTPRDRGQPLPSVTPAPVDGGLGVHVTLDLAGRMRFGPDVEWLATNDPDAVDYTVTPARADSFYAAIRRYWPGLPDGAIIPDYSGCRPKLSGPGAPAADFRIDGPALHGIPGLANLFGIESPGLTASLAIADEVQRVLAD